MTKFRESGNVWFGLKVLKNYIKYLLNLGLKKAKSPCPKKNKIQSDKFLNECANVICDKKPYQPLVSPFLP